MDIFARGHLAKSRLELPTPGNPLLLLRTREQWTRESSSCGSRCGWRTLGFVLAVGGMTLAAASRKPPGGFLNVSAHDILFRTCREDEAKNRIGSRRQRAFDSGRGCE